MTNLYDFLRRVHNDANGQPGSVNITADEMTWLEQYLRAPDVEINFKARATGETNNEGEPVMELNLAIAGDGFEVFAMLCEAMVQNYQFADMATRAVAFYRDHIPSCPICSVKHFGRTEPPKNWIFSHDKPPTDGK